MSGALRRAALLLALLLAAAPAAAQGLAPATVTPPRQTLPNGVAPEDYGLAPGAAGPNVGPDRPAPPAPGTAEAPLLSPEEGRLEISIEDPHADTHVGEMILLRLRGVYTVAIAREEMKQPSLSNFGWQQLGRDSWTSAFVDGKKRTIFERRLALWPSRPGRLEIAPFLHLLTVVDGGARSLRGVASPVLSVEVTPVPPEARGWWLPATRLSYKDEWDRDPSQLASGEVARRTVTVEAVGVPANRLPPRPKMLADWLITFAEPEERTQTLTAEGPVAKVVWRWRMRPVSSEPGTLEAFHIPWFDTATRTVRDIVLRSQKIALKGVLSEEPEPGLAERIVGQAPLLAAVAGFVLSGLALLPGRRGLDRAEARRLAGRLGLSPERWRLRAAVRRGDAAEARRLGRLLLREREARGEAAPRLAEALARLDAALFGWEAAPPGPALAALREALRSP